MAVEEQVLQMTHFACSSFSVAEVVVDGFARAAACSSFVGFWHDFAEALRIFLGWLCYRKEEERVSKCSKRNRLKVIII